MRHTLAAASMTVLAAACVGAERAPPAPPAAPDAWAALAPEPVPVSPDWVADFGDSGLSLVVAEAVAANNDLAQAVARFEQAAAAARLAGAPRLPSVDAGASASYVQNVIDGDIPFDIENRTLSLDLSARWEADVWGRLRDAARAGVVERDAAGADLVGARLSIAGFVAQNWFELIEARLQTDLAEDQVETRERALELTRRRFDSGVAGALDVRLARSELASAQSNLAQRANAQNNAARRLEVLLGRYPAAEIATVGDLPTPPALPGVGVPGELLARRPDVVAAEARLAAAGLRAIAARKALLPSLTFTASGGTSSDTLGELFDPDYLISNAAGSLLTPVFRGGQLRAEVARNRALARERAADYAAVVLTAYREVEDALDAEGALAAQEEALFVAADEAELAERLAERNYTRGVGDIFNLLDAQSRRINAQSALILVRRQRAANRVSLHIALGGGFATSSDAALFEGRADTLPEY